MACHNPVGMSMNKTSQIVVGASVAIVAALAGMLLSRSLVRPAGEAPALAAGTWLDSGRPLPDFALVDQSGRPFGKTGLSGRWNLLFFGFTSCPDICPTTLTTLAGVEKALGDLPANDRPQVVFVSVDPQRDTPDRVDAYVKFFSPTFRGVTGTADGIAVLAEALHVPYAITPLADGTYTVDHSSALFLVGPDASLRAVFSAPHDAMKLAADFRRVVDSATK
jgi:protein SCO1/2